MFANTLTKTISQVKTADREPAHPMTEPFPDTETLARIAGGDPAALSELYTLYGQRLYAYALRLCGEPALAEDVVQEALVTVWKSAGSFRGEGRVISWLLGIVHHTAMKTLRRGQRAQAEELPESLPDGQRTLEEQLQDRERMADLKHGLQRLSPDHRAVLELVFYQGMTLEETAAICGCPLGTVKSRLSYARQHLRGLLACQGQESER